MLRSNNLLRKPRVEALEQRKLLASDLPFPMPPLDSVDLQKVEFASEPVAHEIPVAHEMMPSVTAAEGENVAGPASNPGSADTVLHDSPFRFQTGRERDLIVEDGNEVFSIRQHDSFRWSSEGPFDATLYIHHRQSDGDLILSGMVELELTPVNLSVFSDTIVITSIRSHSQGGGTHLRSIDRGDHSLSTTRIVSGVFEEVTQDRDRLILSTRVSSTRVDEPSDESHEKDIDVNVFTFASGAIQLEASGRTNAPVQNRSILGDRFVLMEQGNPERSRSRYEVAMYEIRVTEIVRVDTTGWLKTIWLGHDGPLLTVDPNTQTATMIGMHEVDSSSYDFVYTIDRIDLSSDSLVFVDHAETPARGRLMVAGENAAMVIGARVREQAHSIQLDSGQGVDSITTVDLFDQDIPSNQRRSLQTRHLGGDQFLISMIHPRPIGEQKVTRDTIVQVYSASRRSIVSSYVLEDFAQTSGVNFSTDAGHFSITGRDHESGVPAVVILSLTDSQGIVEIGRLDPAGTVEYETNAERLLVRKFDQLIEYDWDSLDTPAVARLGSEMPAIRSFDDLYRIPGPRQSFERLDVLENDLYVKSVPNVDDAVIVRLIGAPEGVTIREGVLHLSRELMETDQVYSFQYVLGFGPRRSIANVDLFVGDVTGIDFPAALESAVQDLVRSHGVDRDDIRFERKRVYEDESMPSSFDDGAPNPMAGRYGLILELSTDEFLYRYVASPTGEVFLANSIPVSQIADLIRVDVVPVDDEGQPKEFIKIGDEFFLDFSATDLLPFGKGVLSTSFDLLLPDQLELTGEFQNVGTFRSVDRTIASPRSLRTTLVSVTGSAHAKKVQPLVRIGVRALSAGDVRPRLTVPSGDENHNHLDSSYVASYQVAFEAEELTVQAAGPAADGLSRHDPHDVDRNGKITANDALRVINYLGRHGVTEFDALSGLGARAADGMQTWIMREDERLLDVNRNGFISALDALSIIRRIESEISTRQQPALSWGNDVAAESPEWLDDQVDHSRGAPDQEVISELF